MNIKDIKEQYNKIEKVLGFDLGKLAQGDDSWLKMKLGVISSSNFSKILKPKTQAYKTYVLELAAQVATADIDEQIMAKSLMWGHANEPIAREKYEFITDTNVIELPFIYKDYKMRVGRSPDGIIIDNDGNFLKELEIKCPYSPVHHVALIADGTIKTEYIHQCQSAMWISGLETCDFVSFNPRFDENQLIIKTMERDDFIMKLYAESVEETIFNVDKILSKMDISFGFQWNVEKYNDLQISSAK